jgi:hypothetical protein
MAGSITLTTNATIPEIFNPSNRTWTQIPSADYDVPLYPRIHLLPNGRIFFANQGGGRSKTLDLSTGVWSNASSNNAPRSFSTVQYLPGRILESGNGLTTAVIDQNQTLAAWREIGQMTYSRYNHNLTVLPDGKVLAVGGSSDNSNTTASAVYAAEMWDPDTEVWTTLPSMARPRMYHSMAMLLQDGRVVVAGGGRANTQVNYLNAEFYSPPYLFKGARPTVAYAPAQAPYGANMTILTPDANNIASVVMIANPAVNAQISKVNLWPLVLKFRTSLIMWN